MGKKGRKGGMIVSNKEFNEEERIAQELKARQEAEFRERIQLNLEGGPRKPVVEEKKEVVG